MRVIEKTFKVVMLYVNIDSRFKIGKAMEFLFNDGQLSIIKRKGLKIRGFK